MIFLVVMIHVFEAWKYYVQLEKLDRLSQARQNQMVADSVEYERYTMEIEIMSLEDRWAMQVRIDEIREHEKAMEKMFHDKSKQVYAVRKVKVQEARRDELKRERKAKQNIMNETAWAKILDSAVIEARKEAEAWLITSAGKKALHDAAVYIFEDSPNNVAASLRKDPTYSNIPDCVWQTRLEFFGGKNAKVENQALY